MIKHSEILTVENPPRATTRHRRIQPLSRLFDKAETARQHDESRSRIRFHSIEPFEPARPNSCMRVLLRNTKTMKFFRSAEHWTSDPRQARDFHNGWWATVCAFTMNPRHLVIQYEFDDDRYNLHIPVLGNAQT
jgi:hypothetical protein